MSDVLDYDDLLLSAQEAYDTLQKATSISRLLTDLEAFKSAVEQFGMSRDLMMFANTNDVLTQAIPAIPSLESYLADESVFDTTMAVEGVADTIKKAVNSFFDAFKAHIVKYKEWYKKAVGVAAVAALLLTGGIAYNVATAAPGAFWAAILHTQVGHFVLSITPKTIAVSVGAATLYGALKIAKSTPLAIEEALKLKLPTTVQDRSTYINKIRTIFSDRAGIDIDRIEASRLTGDEKGQSARELGYTKEQIDKAIINIAEALDDVKRCDFIPEKLEDLSKTVEATTSNGRAALIFLTNLINKSMHLAIDNVTQGVHVMKKLQSDLKEAIHEKAHGDIKDMAKDNKKTK